MSYDVLFSKSANILGHQFDLFLIKIDSVEEETNKIISIARDELWISKLDTFSQEAFKIRINSTVCKLINERNKTAGLGLLDYFGEKIVTYNSTKAIEHNIGYSSLPIGDVFKEKADGNPGFDYFNEDTENKRITYGEGKYDKNSRPYGKALNQIFDFINIGKDRSDALVLKLFVDEESVTTNFDKRLFSFGFSCENIDLEKFNILFKSICNNDDFQKIIKNFDVIGVGVIIDEIK